MLIMCGEKRREFMAEEATAQVLSQYYIPTRYPDAMADSVPPFAVYTQAQAREALDGARRILELARRLGGGGA